MAKIKGNPTLLTLLRAGCTVELPSGYALKGDTHNRYIKLINAGGGYDGVRRLDKGGLALALQDAEEDREEREAQANG